MSPFDIPDDVVLPASPEVEMRLRSIPAKVPRGARPGPPAKVREPKVVDGIPATYQERTWRVAEYKPNPAMRRSLDRAKESQPPIISLGGTSATAPKDWPK